MNKLLSLAMVGLVSVGIGLACPAVSEAWVYAPGRQPQPQNVAPSYFNNYNNYGNGYYPGNFNYGFGYSNGYGYYGISGYSYPGFGYNSYSYPGYYGYNNYANPFFTPFGLASPYGY
jgi:hypothetical protein